METNPITDRLKKIFSLDYRSIAFMRIGVGIVLFLDTIIRATSLKAHYTDLGVLPRTDLLSLFNNNWLISIHHMSGSLIFETIIFIVMLLVSISLIVGYKTTIATVLAWILTISVQNRNPLIIQGGDVIFRVILFWAMFLPWGKRFSLDTFLDKRKQTIAKTFVSVASIAYIAEIFMFYFMSGILKTGAAWHNGTAIYYALSVDQFATPIGHFLLGFPALISILTFFVIYLEIYGPFLFIFPFWNNQMRMIGIILFILMQIGINTSMSIGLFGLICIVITFGLLPSTFWTWLGSIRKRAKTGLTIYYDGGCGFCERIVFYIKRALVLSPHTNIVKASTNPDMTALMYKEDSWIVVGEDGKPTTQFDGVITAFSYSPIFFFLAPFFRLPGIYDLGQFLYRTTANSRKKICEAKPKPKTIIKNKELAAFGQATGNLVLATILVFVIFWNVDNLPGNSKLIPTQLNSFAWMTRLDQKFDMFAPTPLTDDGWYVIPGVLRSGDEVDLFRDGAPVTYEKPALVSRTYKDQRWQKYMMNLWKTSYKDYRLPYGKYLCREWNNDHTGDETLQTFKIIFMRENTLPDYQTSTPTPVTTWEHRCF